jgi:hypothetical protein
MAKTSSPSSSLSKEEKKAAKIAARAGKKERRGQIWQAFQTQRKEDKRLLPYMILCVVGSAIVFSGLGLLLASWWAGLVFGLIIGVMIAMIFFARRVQSNVYKQADGTPGAAAWSLQNNQLRGKWRITPAVAGTSHLDAVHRVVGRPGIIASSPCWPRRRRRSPGSSATPPSTTSWSATKRARRRCAS